MAKFRNGNLVLTSSQTIIQGNYTILDATRKGLFNSLDLDSTGATITEFSTDVTLAGSSDAALPTENAVKTYVDAGLAGLSQNKISQLDSKVEVTDTGSNGKIALVADNTQVFQVSAKADNAFYAGTTDPTNTTRLNYDGNFYSTAMVAGGITATGFLTVTGSTKAAAYFYTGTTDPTNTNRLNYDGYFYATRVYNAIWNDIADFQDLAEPAFYAGKCYYDTIEGAKLCTERCQKSVIGVASDTFGYGVGQDSSRTQVSIAVCGWVLANVNDATSCVPGDVLTNDADGNLVKMTDQEKTLYPERIVAIYKRKENNEFFGPNDQVVVNGRHWVKVK